MGFELKREWKERKETFLSVHSVFSIFSVLLVLSMWDTANAPLRGAAIVFAHLSNIFVTIYGHTFYANGTIARGRRLGAPQEIDESVHRECRECREYRECRHLSLAIFS